MSHFTANNAPRGILFWLGMGFAGLLLNLISYHRLPAAAASGDMIIYGVNRYSDIVEINLNTGATNHVGKLSFGTQAADQDPATGYVYYFDREDSAHRFAYWDSAAKTNTIVVTYPQPLGYYPKRLAFDAYGDLYMMDDRDELYQVATDDGAITPLGKVTGLVTGGLGGTGDIAFAPDNTLYLVTYGNLYTVDLNNNEATLLFTDMLSDIGDGVWTGLAYCGSFLYGSAVFFDLEIGTVHRIDPASGVLTEIFSSTTTAFNDLTSCPATSGPPPTATHTSIPPTATETSTPIPPTATETASSVPTATETSTPVLPTATETASPVPTATDTPIPPTATETSTPLPPTATETASPVPTATDTPIPPTATETSTPVPPTATETSTSTLPTATGTSLSPTTTSVATATATSTLTPTTPYPPEPPSNTVTPTPTTEVDASNYVIYIPIVQVGLESLFYESSVAR